MKLLPLEAGDYLPHYGPEEDYNAFIAEINTMKVVDRETAMAKLDRIRRINYCQPEHEMGDAVLCDLLTALGYGDVVEAWDTELNKWYS